MCDTCDGQIVLRTADGFEKVIGGLRDCDIHSYKMPISRPIAGGWYSLTEADNIPVTPTLLYREYRWNGRRRNGIRLLEEVIPDDGIMQRHTPNRQVSMETTRKFIEEIIEQ